MEVFSNMTWNPETRQQEVSNCPNEQDQLSNAQNLIKTCHILRAATKQPMSQKDVSDFKSECSPYFLRWLLAFVTTKGSRHIKKLAGNICNTKILYNSLPPELKKFVKYNCDKENANIMKRMLNKRYQTCKLKQMHSVLNYYEGEMNYWCNCKLTSNFWDICIYFQVLPYIM